jgi:hypothetical protein
MMSRARAGSRSGCRLRDSVQALADLLAPFRQHEGVNLQSIGDVLNANALNLGELDRLELELSGVLPDLSRPFHSGHTDLLWR